MGTDTAKGYPCLDQPGRGQGDLITGGFPNKVNSTTGTIYWPSQALEPIYIWNNTGGIVSGWGGNTYSNDSGGRVVANRDYYPSASGAQTSPTSPFNGTSGTGWGTLANRPTTCTPGVAYFATDQGSWNTSTSNPYGVQQNGADGVLYKCTAPNTWTRYYTPYIYPHPLQSGPAPTPTPTIPPSPTPSATVAPSPTATATATATATSSASPTATQSSTPAPSPTATATPSASPTATQSPTPISFYTTNFPVAENPISEGGHWINGAATGLDWKNCRTNVGLAYGTQDGSGRYDDSTSILAGTWGPNQTCQGTVHSVNQAAAQEEVELRLRSSISPHSCTGYEISFKCEHPGGYAQIVRWNGPLNDFTYVQYGGNGNYHGIQDGDVISATVNDNLIIGYVNGVEVIRGTDSTFSSGSPGIGFWQLGAPSNSDFGFTNFTATDGIAPPSPTPTPTPTATATATPTARPTPTPTPTP